jgi:AraC-like DNA-binding protein/mannose-6-phosphate isomerase-like protein (cupin superfamily)
LLPIYSFDQFDLPCENLNIENLELRSCGLLIKEESWHVNLHKHDYYELIFIKQGNGYVRLGNRQYQVGKGSLALYAPGTLHQESFIDSSTQPIVFHVSYYDDLLKFQSSIFNAHEWCRDVEACFQSLYDEFCSQSQFSGDIRKKLLAALISILYREIVAAGQKNDSYTLSQQVVYFIKKNYSKSVTISDITEALHVSKSYLSHAFKNETGITLMNYLHETRIKKAANLLSTTDDNMSHITSQIGYSSYALFSKWFKRIIGMTPHEYRKLTPMNNTDYSEPK